MAILGTLIFFIELLYANLATLLLSVLNYQLINIDYSVLKNQRVKFSLQVASLCLPVPVHCASFFILPCYNLGDTQNLTKTSMSKLTKSVRSLS